MYICICRSIHLNFSFQEFPFVIFGFDEFRLLEVAMAIASGGSGLASWQQGLRWMDDEEEQDSDTDSKLSGSAMVDSVM